MEERRMDIRGYEGLYQISDWGRVKGLPRLRQNGRGVCMMKERILKKGTSNHQQDNITLCIDKVNKCYNLNRLVADHFLDGDKTMPVIHLDGNANNNRWDNLKYSNRQEYIEISLKNGRKTRAKKVIQKHLDGTFIHQRDSAAAAINKYGQSIAVCLAGGTKKAYGYKREYFIK